MRHLILMIVLAIATNTVFCQAKPSSTDSAKNTSAPASTAFRVKYDYVFKRNSDGSYQAQFPVQINGEMMGSGAPFVAGTLFGGIDVGANAGHDLLIDTIKAVVILRKVLK